MLLAILAHGGTIEAANGPQGGLVITVWLPTVPDAPEDGEHAKALRDRLVSPLPA